MLSWLAGDVTCPYVGTTNTKIRRYVANDRARASGAPPLPVRQSPVACRSHGCRCSSRWGQMGSRYAKSPGAGMPLTLMNSGFSGQVRQESNLQPAVLEHAARCPGSSSRSVVSFAGGGCAERPHPPSGGGQGSPDRLGERTHVRHAAAGAEWSRVCQEVYFPVTPCHLLLSLLVSCLFGAAEFKFERIQLPVAADGCSGGSVAASWLSLSANACWRLFRLPSKAIERFSFGWILRKVRGAAPCSAKSRAALVLVRTRRPDGMVPAPA
jgi:hypothetical protein